MGYTTYFEGELEVIIKNQEMNDKLKNMTEIDFNNYFENSNFKIGKGSTIIEDMDELQILSYINLFSKSRRMKREPILINSDYKKDNNYYGKEGEFFVPLDWDTLYKKPSHFNHGKEVKDNNNSSITQPGLWCKWIIGFNDKDKSLVLKWSGAEKFYDYVEWLEYIIINFLAPKNIILNGKIEWKGEDDRDIGTILVDNNSISLMK